MYSLGYVKAEGIYDVLRSLFASLPLAIMVPGSWSTPYIIPSSSRIFIQVNNPLPYNGKLIFQFLHDVIEKLIPSDTRNANMIMIMIIGIIKRFNVKRSGLTNKKLLIINPFNCD